MLLALHRSLVKPFEPSSRAAHLLGPNVLMPAASRSSTMPATSGAFGADHDEIDLLVLGEGDHRRMVRDVERDAFRLLRDAGIAGRAIELVRERARRHLPGQRMLAAAGTEDQDVHETSAGLQGCSPFGVAWSLGPCKQIRPRCLKHAAQQRRGMDRLRAVGGAASAPSRTPTATCGCAARFPASRAPRPPATAISASRTTRPCSKA